MTREKRAVLIVRMKREHPRMRLKDIATQLGLSYGYARNVYSRFVRGNVTNKGRALEPSLPFNIHGWYWKNTVPSSWYAECPLAASSNRNGQKHFQASSFSFTIHKNGETYVSPLFGGAGWRGDLEAWLRTWQREDMVKVFMDSLEEVGKKEYAFYTPGVPKNYKLTVKGVGSVHTDTTPYPDGTTEWSFDPGFERSIKEAREISNLALSAASETSAGLKKFSEQLNLHYNVLESMRDTLKEMSTPWIIRLLRPRKA